MSNLEEELKTVQNTAVKDSLQSHGKASVSLFHSQLEFSLS